MAGMNTSKEQRQIYENVVKRSGGLCEAMIIIRDTFDVLVESNHRCCKTAYQIHHIGGKGVGGTKRLFREDELIHLCIDCHRMIHDGH